MEEKGIAHFIKYNNTVPIVLGLIFLSTTATFAATPAAREAVYNAEQSVRSVDNSFIIAVNLDDYPFAMRITSITEDDDYYYLLYDFETIDIHEYVWQTITVQKELRISKALLGSGDFEEYVESELAQVRFWELKRLKETQAYEKRLGSSQKTVATVYSGIIGRFMSPTEEKIPQYTEGGDPLRLDKPQKAVTWDANNQPTPSQTTSTPSQPSGGSSGGGPIVVEDVCPSIPGTQINPNDCPTSGGGSAGTSTPPSDGGGSSGGTPPPPEPPPTPEPEPEPEPESEPEPAPEPPAE